MNVHQGQRIDPLCTHDRPLKYPPIWPQAPALSSFLAIAFQTAVRVCDGTV